MLKKNDDGFGIIGTLPTKQLSSIFFVFIFYWCKHFIFSTSGIPKVYQWCCVFSSSKFSPLIFSCRIFPARSFLRRSFPNQVFSCQFFFRQDFHLLFFFCWYFPPPFLQTRNQSNQIELSQTKLKHSLTISNLTQPNII